MVKALYVAGTFDEKGGRASKIGDIVYKGMNIDAEYCNGGYFSSLEAYVDKIYKYDLVFWFANIANDRPKLVKKLKDRHKSFVLVTSKRNTENKYAFSDLVHHALGNKSNLFIELKHNGRYFANIADPLGNVFLQNCYDFETVGKTLRKRVDELQRYTRLSSTRAGENIPAKGNPLFFDLIRQYGDVFHELIHAQHPERFMGNASFRCERGFPSYKKDGLLFVSRRNVDKRHLSAEGFVAVEPQFLVSYYGDFKPSVDTPIQISLYDYYRDVQYMIHSHVYVENAPFTKKVIPCGALEEVDAIKEILPDRNLCDFAVNLKGHGSIVFAKNINTFYDVPYVVRKTPEKHEVW